VAFLVHVLSCVAFFACLTVSYFLSRDSKWPHLSPPLHSRESLKTRKASLSSAFTTCIRSWSQRTKSVHSMLETPTSSTYPPRTLGMWSPQPESRPKNIERRVIALQLAPEHPCVDWYVINCCIPCLASSHLLHSAVRVRVAMRFPLYCSCRLRPVSSGLRSSSKRQ
jgi:hypothetical protein